MLSAGTPQANRKKRPLSSPPEESAKKRVSSTNLTQELDQTFSPSSLGPLGDSGSAGKAYAQRKNAGNVMIRFGDDVPTNAAAKWINSSAFQVRGIICFSIPKAIPIIVGLCKLFMTTSWVLFSLFFQESNVRNKIEDP